jgi:hypothetical protein
MQVVRSNSYGEENLTSMFKYEVGVFTVRIPGENLCLECDIRACARFLGECTSHPERIYSTTTEQTKDNRLSCVLMNSM